MHFHTPHINKGGKRKASLDSVVVEDEAPTEKRKTAKSKKKAKKTKQPTVKTDQEDPMPETIEESEPHPERQPSLTPSRTASPVQSRKDSMHEPQVDHPTTDTQTETPTEQVAATPRRSSRIKNSMHSVSHTWDKCRPYLERINGTIMPLEPQGTKAYYARDGVKVD